MEHVSIPFHSLPFHSILPIQTNPKFSFLSLASSLSLFRLTPSHSLTRSLPLTDLVCSRCHSAVCSCCSVYFHCRPFMLLSRRISLAGSSIHDSFVLTEKEEEGNKVEDENEEGIKRAKLRLER